MLASLIAIAAVAVSVITFLASQREVRRRAGVDYVSELETRCESLERRIEECEEDRKRLHDELRNMRERELELMRRIFRLEKT